MKKFVLLALPCMVFSHTSLAMNDESDAVTLHSPFHQISDLDGDDEIDEFPPLKTGSSSSESLELSIPYDIDESSPLTTRSSELLDLPHSSLVSLPDAQAVKTERESYLRTRKKIADKYGVKTEHESYVCTHNRMAAKYGFPQHIIQSPYPSDGLTLVKASAKFLEAVKLVQLIEKVNKEEEDRFEEECRNCPPEAIYKTGMMYFKTRNDQKALKYFQKAADMGHHAAEHNIGILYEYGRGVRKDLELAKSWYERAESHGSIKAKKSIDRVIQKERSYLYSLFY